MSRCLVIRFGSLGDLCLLAWSLARRAGSGEGVCLATKREWADLLRLVPGVDEVECLEGRGLRSLSALAARLRRHGFDRIIDAHNILRGHLLLMLLSRRPDRRLAKATIARLRLLRGADADPSLRQSMRDRFDQLFEDGGDVAPAVPPLAGLRPAGETVPILGIAPGARWDTKRWPAAEFARLLIDFRAGSDAAVRIFLGPRERGWFHGSELEAAASKLPDVGIVADRSLPEVASELAGCAALVTNDSGLLHLAEATGTPVVALFGPTVRHFGYFPSLPGSRVLEVDLDCRPCSRNGKRACHRGDLACLGTIPAARVLDEVRRVAPWGTIRKEARP